MKIILDETYALSRNELFQNDRTLVTHLLIGVGILLQLLFFIIGWNLS
jgi:hypothetical protein